MAWRRAGDPPEIEPGAGLSRLELTDESVMEIDGKRVDFVRLRSEA